MGKIKIFVRTFWKSITSASYYRDVLRSPFSFSLKYFLFFSFILAIVGTSAVAIPVTTFLPPVITRVQKYARNFFPESLVATVHNGILTINQPEPYVVPLPLELLSDKPVAISDQKRVNLFVYDSGATLTNFDDYHSALVVNKETIMVKGEHEEIRAYSLKDAEDATIDKKFVDKILDTLLPFGNYIVPGIIIVVFILFLIIVPLWKLFSLVIEAFLVWVVASLVIKLPLSYGKTYQIGLHSMTLPTLVQIGFLITGFNPRIPAFYTIFFILYTLILLAHVKEQKKQ